jgi:TetR/AcrR family transcriptional repressor of nem operon
MRADDRLDRVVNLFRARGYYGVSVDELVQRTGLHRAAVYGEFGSRQRLFEASLRRYRATVIRDFLTELDRPDAGMAQIERFFRTIQGAALRPTKRTGCLLVTTASEVSPQIPSVARIVSTFLAELRALLRRACRNAQARRDLRRQIDVDQLADYLVGSVLGLWTLARSPVPATALRHYVDGVLAFVESLRPDAGSRRRARRRLTA